MTGFQEGLQVAIDQLDKRNKQHRNHARMCEVCGKLDHEKPMAFRGERWCSEAHRQVMRVVLAFRLLAKDEKHVEAEHIDTPVNDA